MKYSLEPIKYEEAANEISAMVGAIYGLMWGGLGGLYNGWLYGLINAVVGSIFYGIVGYILFKITVNPVLEYLNEKGQLNKFRLMVVSVLEVLLLSVLPGVILIDTFAHGEIEFYAAFIYFPATVILVGCLLLVCRRNLIPMNIVPQVMQD